MKNVKMRKLHVYRLTSFVVIKKVAGGVFDGGSNVVNYNGKALFVFQGGVGIIFHNEQAPFLFVSAGKYRLLAPDFGLLSIFPAFRLIYMYPLCSFYFQ